MNDELFIHIENLKQALLSLSPTAEKGFEGLIGVTLNAITGIPFRLAASGSQFGIDGDAAYVQDTICFEGKRYDKKIPKDQIFTKLFEISISDSVTDIWILGATSQVSTQIAAAARKFGEKEGISILILDWAATTLPPFAVALAMGKQKVANFLVTNLDSQRHICDVKAALQAITAHSDFSGAAQKVANECDMASVGTALAKKKNANWLNCAFSNKAMAKKRLGQPIFPRAISKKIIQRQALIKELTPCFNTIGNSVIFALGGEGHGKSWIIAQSWLALQQQPILLFCNPEDFLACSGQTDLEPILIDKLIEQTGNDNSPAVVARWRRIFKLWHKQEYKQLPHIVVVIDGINQKPNIDWARIIDNLHDELYCKGGRLIVTARTPYFTEVVQRRLESANKQINVPEWSPQERDEILIQHGIKPSEVRIKVANALKNPRLLDIALTLLDKQAITHFEELSISRLLFEHIRTSEKDALEPIPAGVFIKQLQTDAQTILSRIKEQQTDDIYVFENDVVAVADGRFYQALADDPTLYTLQDDGLTLALGFAIVDLLKKAKRRGRNLDNELATLLEPIQVLDDTSDVLIGAITIVVLTAVNLTDITVALIKGFVSLQNPMSNRFSVFASLVKINPQALLAVAKELCLSGSYQRNFDWVKEALLLAGNDKKCWLNMEDEVLSWLCLHSLSPDLRAFNNDKRRTENLAKINADLQSLSAGEQEVLARSAEVEDGNLGWLAELAFKLLVGKPLAPYADILITWKLTQVLNSQISSPTECFTDLIRLNRIDWRETRTALLTSSKSLQEEDASTTGRWALLAILEATGESTDGCKKDELFASLVDDPKRYDGWRLVEKYCKSDPCDPAAVAPQNVKKTAADYMALNINKQMQFATNDADMGFWQDARPAGVRFFADIVVIKHRELIADVLNRKDLPLSTAMHEMGRHSALLLKQDVSQFVTKWRNIRTGEEVMDFTDEDSWHVPLQLLLFAFPWLSSQEQMDLMLSGHLGDKVFYSMLELCNFKANKAFANKLIKVCEDKNEPEQFLLLLLAWYVLDTVPIAVRQSVVDSIHSDSQRIRERALGIVLSTDDEWLIAQVVQSDYNAARTQVNDRTEVYYGSRVFIRAVKKKLISSEQGLNRIAATYYGEAAIELDAVSVNKIVGLVELAICCAGDIEYQLDNSVFAVNKAEVQVEHNEFYRFADTLTKAKAWAFLNANKTYQIKALTDNECTLQNQWLQYFALMSDGSIGAIGKFVMNFSCMISENDPKTAATLIQRIYNSRSYTNWIYGSAKIAHDAFITWRAGPSPILDKLRFARLDTAKTDKELAQEVVTALLEEQQTLLQSYIERQLAREEPHEVARGIMVAGFADNNDFNTEVLTRFTNENGLIGSAIKAANYAYERNIWAKHWFGLMNSTKDPVGFWRYKVLFVKLVDKRFELWQQGFAEDKGECNKLFAHTYDDDVKRRYDSWDKHREKTLFGEKAPKPIFLNLDNNGVEL